MLNHTVKQLVKNKARAGLKATKEVTEVAVKTPPKPKPQPKATTPKPQPQPKPKQVQADPVTSKQEALDKFQETFNRARERKRNGLPPEGPITAEKLAARDVLVDNNIIPVKGSVAHTDHRSVTGEVQAGIKYDNIRNEGRPEYKSAQTGLPEGEFNGKSRKHFTPHHVNGLQDAVPFYEGKTPLQRDKRNADLAMGGVFTGNQKANYESLFDGKKSARASSNNGGIMSSDHADVHDLNDLTRKKFGIEAGYRMVEGKKVIDRSLDTFNGFLIKDMPEHQQLALQLQLAWRDEIDVMRVQAARYKAFKKKFGHLSQAEQREIILNNPELFANLSTNV